MGFVISTAEVYYKGIRWPLASSVVECSTFMVEPSLIAIPPANTTPKSHSTTPVWLAVSMEVTISIKLVVVNAFVHVALTHVSMECVKM